MTQVLVAQGISKTYRDGTQAVAGVDLKLGIGECLGIVGESGSGKSTLARCLLGVERLTAGRIWLDDVELTALSPRVYRKQRTAMQVVFQNAMGAFNSRLRIVDSLLEPLECQRGLMSELYPGKQRRQVAQELMELVGLDPELIDRFPRQLSGGQLQRVSIARALSTRPRVVVLDEPTASLDVSVQARILNLLQDLREQLGVAYLFITHDLGAARFMSDRIHVMQHGQVVDRFDVSELLAEDRADYTRELVSLVR